MPGTILVKLCSPMAVEVEFLPALGSNIGTT